MKYKATDNYFILCSNMSNTNNVLFKTRTTDNLASCPCWR